MRLGSYLWIVSWLLAAPCALAQPAIPIEWLDDLGAPLPAEAELEVCRVQGLERVCETATGAELPGTLPPFDLLQVEGPRHGPVSLAPAALEPGPDGRRQIRLPRKARVTVRGLDDPRATFSLYRQDDPDFLKPGFRRAGQLDQPFFVPAGAFVASTWQPGAAPELRLVDLPPGSRHDFEPEPRAGWSLLLRTVAQASGEPVAEVDLEVRASPGFAVEPGKPYRRRTNATGLAVVNALGLPLAQATARHPDHLETVEPALSATPSSFAFRRVELQQGGSFRARVRLDGEPVGAGTECRVLAYDRVGSGALDPPRDVARLSTDEDGACHGTRIRQGRYVLRVRVPGQAAPSAEFLLEVREGEETEIAADLEEILVAGRVSRGSKGAEGYVVSVMRLDTAPPNATEKDATASATTDEEGEYEIRLWRPGEHSVFVLTAQQFPGDLRIVDLDPGRHTVDFELGEIEIVGQVVDPKGAPAPEARVTMVWNGHSHRGGIADAEGRFSIPTPQDQGTAELTALKNGFAASEPLPLELAQGQSPPPVVLRLQPQPEIRGRLVRPSGQGVPGGGVLSYRIELQEPTLLGLTDTEGDGSFAVPSDPGEPTRLFFSGPGCPLTTWLVAPPAGPAPATAPQLFTCAPAPAHLEIVLRSAEGAPHRGKTLLLKREEVIFPRETLVQHLFRMGVPAATDGNGRLIVPALEPGRYDLYLADLTSPFNILVGAPNGYLASVELQPWSTSTAEVTVDVR